MRIRSGDRSNSAASVYTVAATGIDEYDPATMARLGSLNY